MKAYFLKKLCNYPFLLLLLIYSGPVNGLSTSIMDVMLVFVYQMLRLSYFLVSHYSIVYTF